MCLNIFRNRCTRNGLLVCVLELFTLNLYFHFVKSIQCIEAGGNDLYLGSNDSLVFHVSVGENIDASTSQITYSWNIICQKHLGTKKPVVQIKVASALGKVLALSDGSLYLLDADLLNLVGNGPKMKNVLVFCANENPTILDPFTLQFCVGKKRCLQICSLHEERVSLLREVNMQDQPLNLAMDGNYVCVAGTTQYCIYNVDSGHSQPLFPCDSSLNYPLIKRILKEEFLVMAPGNLGMFVTSAGTSERPPVQWSEGIVALSYYHPYVLTLTKTFIRIYSLIDQQHKQTILFNGGVLLGNFDGQLYIATDCSVHCLIPQPWTSQVMALLENESIDEALELLEHSGGAGMVEEKYLAFSRIIFQKSGFIEFVHGSYSKAQDYFVNGRLDIRELLCLYPEMLPANNSFIRAQPPLHSFVDINQAFHSDRKMILEAKDFLLSFLLFIRTRFEFKQYQMEVDTALIKLYVEMRPDELLTFLDSGDIFCSLADCTHSLEKEKNFASLAKLYRNFDQTEKCLEVLSKLVLGELSDTRFRGISQLVDSILNFSDEELIWRYADFVLSNDEDEGLRMMCECQMDLDHNKVLKLLLSYPNSRIKYLNYVIYDKKLEDETFHTELVLFYINVLLERRQEDSHFRTKLQDLLQISEKYNIKTVLSRLQGTYLILETAIAYGKMNLHEKALSLLVHELKDFVAAENYCVMQMRNFSPAQKSRLLSTLLRIYLRPALGAPSDVIELSAALELLSVHAAEFDTSEVLEILPPDWSVSILHHYLKGSLRANMSKNRMQRLQHNLIKNYNIQKKYLFQNKVADVGPINLTSNSVCSVCEKGFRDCSFCLYPNGVLTHPECGRDPTVCPLTGMIFKVLDPSTS